MLVLSYVASLGQSVRNVVFGDFLTCSWGPTPKAPETPRFLFGSAGLACSHLSTSADSQGKERGRLCSRLLHLQPPAPACCPQPAGPLWTQAGHRLARPSGTQVGDQRPRPSQTREGDHLTRPTVDPGRAPPGHAQWDTRRGLPRQAHCGHGYGTAGPSPAGHGRGTATPGPAGSPGEAAGSELRRSHKAWWLQGAHIPGRVSLHVPGLVSSVLCFPYSACP